MQSRHFSVPGGLAPEERAFLLQLAALNTALEAASAGETARPFATRAEAIDDLLNRCFHALIAETSTPAVV